MDRDASSPNRQPVPTDTGATAARGEDFPSVTIADHELLRCIGRGSYGQVWLARNSMGRYRAVKIVYRKSFQSQRPFERELSGIRKFEPVSRSHEGFVDVLHIGINAEQGYFYYVMELGDDQSSGQQIDPASYSPKTLAREIAQRSQLSLQECLRLGLALSDALAELHKHGLVHRDVKPSNIIFVNGVPKLADIGLVADASEARSYVGTEGFIPPEGPGNPQADVYSLGKVLYEASTGKDRQDFPALPAEFDRSGNHEGFLELNEVILCACEGEAGKRYHSAAEMHADLTGLADGKSVKRLKLERRLSTLKRIAAVLVLVSSVLAAILYSNRERRIAIAGFSPMFGATGDSVTIIGTNFSPKPANNIVHFGTARGVVTAASEARLVVRVPPGATYAPISVTARRLTAYAHAPFALTFAGGDTIDPDSLAPRVDLGVGSGPYQVAFGNLDGDGKPDLVVVHAYDGNVWVFRNLSTEGTLAEDSFASVVVLRIGGATSSLHAVELADVDGDGRLDIVVPNYGNNNVSIFQNQSVGDGMTSNSFSSRVDIFVGAGPRGVAVRDLDGDGKPDIVIANYGGDGISILRNMGRTGMITVNSFAPGFELAADKFTESVAVGDLDGDGKPDIVASGNGILSVFRNRGTGEQLTTHTFAPKAGFPGGGNMVAIGDLDGDGKPDLVSGFYLRELMAVCRNTTTRGDLNSNSFALPVELPAGGRVHHVAVGNMDGDDKPDIALVTELESKLSLFKNTSTPGSLSTNSFAARVDFSSGWNACGLAIGDLDGDGRPDIAFGNSYSNSVSIYRNVITSSRADRAPKSPGGSSEPQAAER